MIFGGGGLEKERRWSSPKMVFIISVKHKVRLIAEKGGGGFIQGLRREDLK